MLTIKIDMYKLHSFLSFFKTSFLVLDIFNPVLQIEKVSIQIDTILLKVTQGIASVKMCIKENL